MPFEIDLSEEFPHLPGAPIVEAVIHWRARAETKLQPEQLRRELMNRLPEYPDVHPQHEVEAAAKGTLAESQVTQRARWRGFRLQRDDERFVAQFTADGLVFSRLETYDCWESFEQEALRLWNVFVELAAPADLKRLGVRFNNRMELSAGEGPQTFLRHVARALDCIGLPIDTFVDRDVYGVPKTPYRIQLMRTIQTPGSFGALPALTLDIGVSAGDLGFLEQESLVEHLAKMRWLKNKVFFSCITDHAKDVFQKGRRWPLS